jgi:DNA-binding MurR/RpiR family transcriptional regulator
VVGSDLAASLASFFAYALLPLGFDAEIAGGHRRQPQHKVRLLARKDLLVAISFGRCLRVTVEAAKLARAAGSHDRDHGQRHHAPGPRM